MPDDNSRHFLQAASYLLLASRRQLPQFFRAMREQTNPPAVLALWIGSGVILWLLYSVVFAISAGWRGLDTLFDALANVLPLAALAVAAYQILKPHLRSGSVFRQFVLHMLLAPLFALTWYSLVAVLLGLLGGLRGRGFTPEGFSGPAATWQIFQGLILYAFVAAVCYAIRGGREAAQVTIVNQTDTPLSRYLVREEQGLRPIEVAEIIAVTGAQDYSEVSTIDGKHLVRMSLGEFERMLDSSQFVRVHRSAIISLKHLELAESAGGGRMVARMMDGETIPVSRSGAILLREFVA